MTVQKMSMYRTYTLPYTWRRQVINEVRINKKLFQMKIIGASAQ